MGISASRAGSVPIGRRKAEMLGSDWEARLEEARARRAAVLAAKTSPQHIVSEKPWEAEEKLRTPKLIDEAKEEVRRTAPTAAAPAMPDLISEDLEHPAPTAVLVAEGDLAQTMDLRDAFRSEPEVSKAGWSAWSVAAAAALLIGVPIVGYAVLSGEGGLLPGPTTVGEAPAPAEGRPEVAPAASGASGDTLETAALSPDASGARPEDLAANLEAATSAALSRLQEFNGLDGALIEPRVPDAAVAEIPDRGPEVGAMAETIRPTSRPVPGGPAASVDQTPRPVLPEPLPLQSGLPVPTMLSLGFRVPAPATPIAVAAALPSAAVNDPVRGDATALARPAAAVWSLPRLPAPLPAPATLRDTPSSLEFPERLAMARIGAGDVTRPLPPATDGAAPAHGAYTVLAVPAGDAPLGLPVTPISVAPVSFSGIVSSGTPEADGSGALDIAMLDGWSGQAETVPELSAPATATEVPGVETVDPPAPQPAFRGTVFFHAPGTVSTEALRREAEQVSAGTGLEITVRPPVSFKISASNVRYFHDEDRDAAAAVAERLSARLRDFTNFDPAPEAGTIEVWLAGEPASAPAASASEPVAAAAPPAAVQPSTPAPAATTRRAPVQARPAPTPTFETKTITRTRRGGVGRLFGQ